MTTPTFTQARALAHYQALQREAEETIEAWRNPPARVSPSVTRRHDDTAPKWPQYVLMTVFSLGATWGFFMLCAHGIPAFRHFLAALWGAS
jgi:hypothetical protein